MPIQEGYPDEVRVPGTTVTLYIGRPCRMFQRSLVKQLNCLFETTAALPALTPTTTVVRLGELDGLGFRPFVRRIFLMKLPGHVISFLAGFLVSSVLLLTHQQRSISEPWTADLLSLEALQSTLHLSAPRLTRQLLITTGSDDHSVYLPQWSKYYGGFKSRWHHTVLKSVHKAERLLRTSRRRRARRFFVPMLSSRHSELCCMLTDLNKKVAATNKLDVFVFSVENAAHSVFFESECRSRKFNLTVNFMALDEHWRLGHGTNPATSSSAFFDTSDWMGGHFNEDYRRMGHWRLAFQFAFADMLGYRYVWQLDDDSHFRTPVTVNLMEYMQERNLWVGGLKYNEYDFVAWGLPEIARLYLVAERMAPMGPLFSSHTQPAGLQGLYSVVNETLRPANQELQYDEGGWDKRVIWGNCVIVDMDKFWWPKHVQKFVELVLLSGYHFRFRWNEQGVMGMVSHMFVPEDNTAIDTLPVDYEHPHDYWGSCSGTTSND